MNTASRMSRAGLAIVATVLAAACSIDKQTAPDVTGPSEFGLAVTMTATPDQLPRNGTAQSVVTVTARDPNGSGIAGQRFAITVTGAAGVKLSATSVTTDSGGNATFAVGAPPSDSFGDTLTVIATPVTTNFANDVARKISIALTGASTRTAAVGQTVFFDAGIITSSSGATITKYEWDFGDGATATGMMASHAFNSANVYVVSLKVTDTAGRVETMTQYVSVQ